MHIKREMEKLSDVQIILFDLFIFIHQIFSNKYPFILFFFSFIFNLIILLLYCYFMILIVSFLTRNNKIRKERMERGNEKRYTHGVFPSDNEFPNGHAIKFCLRFRIIEYSKRKDNWTNECKIFSIIKYEDTRKEFWRK